jgi:hypothetical protein
MSTITLDPQAQGESHRSRDSTADRDDDRRTDRFQLPNPKRLTSANNAAASLLVIPQFSKAISFIG